MATVTHSAPRASRLHVVRSRGAVTGVLLVLLGIWGGIIPFVGPVFGYAYTPDTAWHFTTGRLYLEILPAAATIVGGLLLLASANRAYTQFGAWLAAVAGAWFAVGPTLSVLFHGGSPAAGTPASAASTQAAIEELGFFVGLGVVVVFLAAVGLGRHSVVGIRDVGMDRRAAERATGRDNTVAGKDTDG